MEELFLSFMNALVIGVPKFFFPQIDPFYTEELLPLLNIGLYNSILLIIPSASIGFILGAILGSLQTYANPVVAKTATIYSQIFRGTPLVLQLLIIYFGLPAFNIVLSPYFAAVIGFTLCTSAYQAEYIRGALVSIKKEQTLAAYALGFSKFATIKNIILPQALRRALPGCGNEIIYLIKYSSLAYVVTFYELTGNGKKIASLTFRVLDSYFILALYYLFLVSIATLLLHYLEKNILSQQ